MKKRRFTLALIAGAASVFGYAPFTLAPVAIVTLAILFWSWREARSPREAAWTGFGFGLGMFLASVSWIYVSLMDNMLTGNLIKN